MARARIYRPRRYSIRRLADTRSLNGGGYIDQTIRRRVRISGDVARRSKGARASTVVELCRSDQSVPVPAKPVGRHGDVPLNETWIKRWDFRGNPLAMTIIGKVSVQLHGITPLPKTKSQPVIVSAGYPSLSLEVKVRVCVLTVTLLTTFLGTLCPSDSHGVCGSR